MLDAMVVRLEAVLDTPQDSLGAAADVDLAVDRADVGLHGVRAEICQRRYFRVALALRDERQNLGLAIAEPFAAAGPIQSDRAARSRRHIADDSLAGVHGLQCGDQLACGQRLGEIAVHSVPSRTF